MKTSLKKVMLVLLLGVASQTQAAIIDTSGVDFDLGGLTWTSSFQYFAPAGSTDPVLPGDGFIRTGADAVNGELEIQGSNNGTGVYSETAMYSTTAVDGTLDFSWIYGSPDLADLDFFIWINEGTGDATRTLALSAASGVESLVLGAGSLFGLSIDTRDNTFGAGFVDISGLQFTAAGGVVVSTVPVPGALALFGIALAGLGFVRKQKAPTGLAA
jgi:hypothetical protein